MQWGITIIKVNEAAIYAKNIQFSNNPFYIKSFVSTLQMERKIKVSG